MIINLLNGNSENPAISQFLSSLTDISFFFPLSRLRVDPLSKWKEGSSKIEFSDDQGLDIKDVKRLLERIRSRGKEKCIEIATARLLMVKFAMTGRISH
jgi:hypothetical protein